MPGFLSGYNSTTRLFIDPDKKWWIDVKDHLSRREQATASAALIQSTVRYVGIDDAETTGSINTTAYQMELVVASVVDWNLTDEEDQPLPLSPDEDKRESINRLPSEVFTTIIGHVQGIKREAMQPQRAATFPKVGPRRSGR